jgi:hypothetical protein
MIIYNTKAHKFPIGISYYLAICQLKIICSLTWDIKVKVDIQQN